MPLFFLGTREWRNRQTRTVQVRVPVMEWGFNSPLAHDETADPLRICGFCFLWSRLRCCLWLRWCSGRRRPRPPARLGDLTSLCAAPRSPPVPSGPSGALRTCGAWCAVGWLGASPQSPARPRHRPRAPQPGPAAAHGHRGQAPPPPAGAAARPRRSPWALRGLCALSFWGASVRVVTNVVNRRCFSCGFLPRCYKRRQSEGFFAENSGYLA